MTTQEEIDATRKAMVDTIVDGYGIDTAEKGIRAAKAWCTTAAQESCNAAYWRDERDAIAAQLTKATADAEAHRMRCASLETQLEAAKRAGLESDRRAHDAEARLESVLSDLEGRISTLEGMLCP